MAEEEVFIASPLMGSVADVGRLYGMRTDEESDENRTQKEVSGEAETSDGSSLSSQGNRRLSNLEESELDDEVFSADEVLPPPSRDTSFIHIFKTPAESESGKRRNSTNN